MDIGTTDFMLPALTVQPLVENAVKWGIGKRENGGTVRLATRMTPLGVEGLRAALSGEPKGHGIVIDARGAGIPVPGGRGACSGAVAPGSVRSGECGSRRRIDGSAEDCRV